LEIDFPQRWQAASSGKQHTQPIVESIFLAIDFDRRGIATASK
jgi:hypothetical protein